MTFANLTQPIGSKITACEQRQETWKRTHQEALAVFRFEDLLNDVVECYDDLQRFDKYILDRVAKDGNAYDDDLDAALIELSRRLHEVAERVAENLLPEFEAEFESVENAENFRNRLQQARESMKHGYRRDVRQRNETLVDELFDSLGLKRAS